MIDPTYIPQSPSPNLLLCPTIDMPRKLTVSMFKVTLIMFKDMVESVEIKKRFMYSSFSVGFQSFLMLIYCK